MTLTFKLSKCGDLDPPEPFFVAEARHAVKSYAKNHPDLELLLIVLEEAAAYSSKMRALSVFAREPAVRQLLKGRYGFSSAAENACADMQIMAWDWHEDRYLDRMEHRNDDE